MRKGHGDSGVRNPCQQVSVEGRRADQRAPSPSVALGRCVRPNFLLRTSGRRGPFPSLIKSQPAYPLLFSSSSSTFRLDRYSHPHRSCCILPSFFRPGCAKQTLRCICSFPLLKKQDLNESGPFLVSCGLMATSATDFHAGHESVRATGC